MNPTINTVAGNLLDKEKTQRDRKGSHKKINAEVGVMLQVKLHEARKVTHRDVTAVVPNYNPLIQFFIL